MNAVVAYSLLPIFESELFRMEHDSQNAYFTGNVPRLPGRMRIRRLNLLIDRS